MKVWRVWERSSLEGYLFAECLLPPHTSSHLSPQVFQQLVELKESGRILSDLANGNTRRDHTFNEMREIMESWRCE